MSREIDLPYLAGFFDGEGSIGIYGNTNTGGQSLRVQLTQTVGVESDLIMGELQDRWNGSLSIMNRTLRRQAWIFQASGENGARMLRDLLPYLRIKRAQANVALDWFDGREARQRGERGRVLPRTQADLRRTHDAMAILKQMKQEV